MPEIAGLKSCKLLPSKQRPKVSRAGLRRALKARKDRQSELPKTLSDLETPREVDTGTARSTSPGQNRKLPRGSPPQEIARIRATRTTQAKPQVRFTFGFGVEEGQHSNKAYHSCDRDITQTRLFCSEDHFLKAHQLSELSLRGIHTNNVIGLSNLRPRTTSQYRPSLPISQMLDSVFHQEKCGGRYNRKHYSHLDCEAQFQEHSKKNALDPSKRSPTSRYKGTALDELHDFIVDEEEECFPEDSFSDLGDENENLGIDMRGWSSIRSEEPQELEDQDSGSNGSDNDEVEEPRRYRSSAPSPELYTPPMRATHRHRRMQHVILSDDEDEDSDKDDRLNPARPTLKRAYDLDSDDEDLYDNLEDLRGPKRRRVDRVRRVIELDEDEYDEDDI